MATTKEYKDFVLEQLNLLDDISCKKMMGVDYDYDGTPDTKIVESNKKYNMSKETPYGKAKLMFLVDNIDDKEELKNIVLDTYNNLLH